MKLINPNHEEGGKEEEDVQKRRETFNLKDKKGGAKKEGQCAC